MKWLNLLLAPLALCVLHLSPAYGQTKGQELLDQVQVLDLHTAQCIALSASPGISAAQERVAQAQARLRQAVATWWPSLDLSAGGMHQRLSDTSYALNRRIATATGQNLDQSSMHYSTGLQATWLLFDGFYRSFNEKRAQLAQQAEEEGLNDSRRLLAAAVAQVFLQAQLAQTHIDIDHANRTFYTRLLDNAQRRYEVGVGPWGDVLNIQVQLNNVKASLLVHQRELQAAEYGLAALLGSSEALLPPHVRLTPLAKNPERASLHAMQAQQLIEEAYALRPDVRRIEHRLQEAEALAGMAKASLYPRVQLAGALEGKREDDLPVENADYGNSIGVNMSWNLYAGGADKARMAEAGHARLEAAYSLAALRNQVASEIRTSLAQLAEAEQQLRLQQDTVKLVEKSRQLAENAYIAGEYALIQLNEAQRDLTTNSSRLAQALVSYQSAQQQLLEASGRILESFQAQPHCLQDQ
ncbi:MAG: TolC family protein [Desulfobulbaceae bacterium]|nr:TolC family protein [Desulfobulbaceae bacterium]